MHDLEELKPAYSDFSLFLLGTISSSGIFHTVVYTQLPSGTFDFLQPLGR